MPSDATTSNATTSNATTADATRAAKTSPALGAGGAATSSTHPLKKSRLLLLFLAGLAAAFIGGTAGDFSARPADLPPPSLLIWVGRPMALWIYVFYMVVDLGQFVPAYLLWLPPLFAVVGELSLFTLVNAVVRRPLILIATLATIVVAHFVVTRWLLLFATSYGIS